MRIWWERLICAAAILIAASSGVRAQETTGTITGVVTDDSGAVLPGVTVTIRQIETGRSVDVTSSASGTYVATLLPIGTYDITFTMSGFSSVTVKGVALSVNDRLQVPGKLSVGGLAESVQVDASTQMVQPVSAVQSLIGSRQLQELPLNNRNFVQLATLVPGVSSDLSDEVGVGLTSTVSISVNGGRRNAVNWLLDGVQNVDVGSNITLLSTPTLESIQEFKIITSSYAAEWPRSGGGIINVITKSGASKFTGSAYEFLRNDKLNANSFFRNLSSNPDISGAPPRLRYNNFGYTAGGPVLPSRQRLFFFFSEEWRRITRAPGSTTFNTIDPAWLTDPSNANYVAPADRDPNAVRLLEAWPQPNIPGGRQYILTVPSINNTRQEVARVDYDLAKDWRIMGRYTHDLSETREPSGLFQGTTVPNIAATDTGVPGNVAVLSVRTSRGRWLNELSYQFSSNRIGTVNPDGTRGARGDYGLQIPEIYPENAANRIPSVTINGVQGIFSMQAFNIEYKNHTIADNLTFQRGSHSFKTGLLMSFEQKNENAANLTQGTFLFAEGGGRTAFQNFLTGNRDGRCGTPCTYSEDAIDITNHLRFNRYEFYVQDSWQARSNLTFDYGVRYAYYPAIVDANNILDTFDPAAYDPAQAPAFANAAGSLLTAGTGNLTNGIIVAGADSPFGRGIYAADKNNIQPRAGATWDPQGNGRMILRAGYGVYFDQPLVGIFEQNAFVNPPFNNRTQVLNPSLSNPGGGIPPATRGLPALQATSTSFDSPRTQQWNVGMQRQLYRHAAIDIGYVGSRGDGLIRPIDINLPQPADVVAAGGNLNRVRPYLGYAGITMRETTARSRYHGLLATFKHDQGTRGSVTLNYTLSRNRTDASNDRDAVDLPQNPLNPGAEYADARTDRRHIFSGNFVYLLPFFEQSPHALLKTALGGWQLAGIVTISSGPPAARVTVNVNGSRRGNRANLVGNPAAGEQDTDGTLYWIDPAAFAPPADGTYGDSLRAPFRLPGRHQWDLTLSKNFYPTQRLRFQFRAELINAFNHTQWLAVDQACGVSLTTCVVPTDTFGKVTSTRLPREVQLGMKIYW